MQLNEQEELTDWLQFVKINIVDRAQMSWQFIEDSSGGSVPNVDESVRRSGRHHGAVGRPGAVQ